jgi:hypothetical protein
VRDVEKSIILSNKEIETLMNALNYKEMDLGWNSIEKSLYEKLLKILSE